MKNIRYYLLFYLLFLVGKINEDNSLKVRTMLSLTGFLAG